MEKPRQYLLESWTRFKVEVLSRSDHSEAYLEAMRRCFWCGAYATVQELLIAKKEGRDLGDAFEAISRETFRFMDSMAEEARKKNANPIR